MNTNLMVSQMRMVRDFDRVVLKAQHVNELILTQGDREALTVHAPADILPRIESEVRQGRLVFGTGGGWLDKLGDALTTSLTRPRIRYELTVKRLAGLEVYAIASVYAASLKANSLALRFNGMGEIRIDSLDSELLEVDLPGAGKIEVAGYVAEQRVTVSGPGHYDAAKLQSHRAKVTLRGIGAITVWAVRELEVTMRGPGRVSYYGTPRIKKSLAPMASLSYLGSY
jgi:Putative auto-transporter adhesin, head GIN domain